MSVPTLLIFSQDYEHDDASIIGNRSAIEKLHARLGAMLQLPDNRDFEEFFVNDGEGFTLYIELADDDTLDKYPTPYGDRYG